MIESNFCRKEQLTWKCTENIAEYKSFAPDAVTGNSPYNRVLKVQAFWSAPFCFLSGKMGICRSEKHGRKGRNGDEITDKPVIDTIIKPEVYYGN